MPCKWFLYYIVHSTLTGKNFVFCTHAVSFCFVFIFGSWWVESVHTNTQMWPAICWQPCGVQKFPLQRNTPRYSLGAICTHSKINQYSFFMIVQLLEKVTQRGRQISHGLMHSSSGFSRQIRARPDPGARTIRFHVEGTFRPFCDALQAPQ